MTKQAPKGAWIPRVTNQNREVLDDVVKHLDRVSLFDV